jgi:Domain of unknown function (DUF5658)
VVLLEPPLAKLRALVLTNVGLQVLDGHLTLKGLDRGFSEGNPILGRIMETVGPTEAVLATKLLAIAVLFLVYRHAWRQRSTTAALASLAILYVSFAIVPWAMLLARSG